MPYVPLWRGVRQPVGSKGEDILRKTKKHQMKNKLSTNDAPNSPFRGLGGNPLRGQGWVKNHLAQASACAHVHAGQVNQ